MQQHPASPALSRALDRSAGVCLHITSLPGDYGIGEIGAAALAFIDAMTDMRLNVWQFLPLGPTAFGDSPYQPTSSFAGNELLIDTQALIQQGYLKPADANALRELPRTYVDYGALIPLKSQLLEKAAGRFLADASEPERQAFKEFLDANDADWLHDYALFKTLKAHHGGRAWRDWEAPLAERNPDALAVFQSAAAHSVDIAKAVQYFFYSQWSDLRDYARERDVVLFGDMPIYIAEDSADVWADRSLVCLDEHGAASAVAGVPPDYFSEDGQLWGNPLYDWPRHASDGYVWWTRRLRQAVELADIVRIDHFRGFEAYWSIPGGADSAKGGQWIQGPGEALFSALRAGLGHLPIIAEDLGVITPEVEALRDRYHLPGMRVLQFEVGNDGFTLASICENSVCYTGTHDNDTVIGWLNGNANDRRSDADVLALKGRVLDITGGSPECVATDLTRLAFESAAGLAVAPLQDFLNLGSEARMNTPGADGNHWSWRVTTQQLDAKLIKTVRQINAATHRGS